MKSFLYFVMGALGSFLLLEAIRTIMVTGF